MQIEIINFFIIIGLCTACFNKTGQNEKYKQFDGAVFSAERETVTIDSLSSEQFEKNIPVYSKCTNCDNSLSTIASKIRFVPLAVEPPLRDFFVNDVELSEDYIFLLGPDYINQYDWAGKLIRKIGAKGMGPNEYILLNPPLQLDRERQLVYAVDGKRNRIVVYDFGGVFKKAIPLSNINSGYIALLDSSTIALRTDDADRFRSNALSLLLIDNNGKKTKSYKSNLYPLPKGEHFGPEANYLWSHRDVFYTMEYGCDTVYQITKEVLLPKLILTGEQALKKDELFIRDIGDKKSIGAPLFRPNASIFESDNFILFRMMGMKERNFLVYSKTTAELHRTLHKNAPKLERMDIILSDYFTDDLVSGMSFNPQYQSRGQGIGFITSTDIIENKDEILDFIRTHPSEEGKHLKEIVSRIDEMDNSVLMIVDFK